MGVAPAKVVASLLENGSEEGHLEEIDRRLAHATHVICIVAFAKYTGWGFIKNALRERAAKGLKATFVIGLNFYQSEPVVLRGIRRLQSTANANGGEIKLYISEQSGATLHPKVYWIKGRSGQTLIVGSANMTWGGLSGNHELSALLTGSAAKQEAWLRRWIDARIKAHDIVEATEELIKAYERRRDIHQAAMKIAERKASRAMEAKPGDPVTLAALLVEMRADKGSEGFDASTKRRRENLLKARGQLEVLTRKPDLKRRGFLDAYEELIGYWHSSGMARGKTTVAKKPAQFQAALRALVAEQSDDPALLFDLLKAHFAKIPRAGTNVLTEILHVRDPARFPVMNQNSVKGMGLANITDYPRLPKKATVDGARYARFAAHAEALRNSLDLVDLSELDALFNYAYSRTGDEDDDE
ncbi:phospholipase D family protein [Sphingomonas sp. IC-56]|uniref:phospholipase D family protein n=1 Tax=Sphingomonas sp. IC-56 TaxID=2898529 RepID=UPI001E474257|nr:phospholipase D family protein [Sphingomonas sp. IC-56]MCD2323470.1 phospholipase D family protein [Sphingomonas sp. IC-56]